MRSHACGVAERVVLSCVRDLHSIQLDNLDPWQLRGSSLARRVRTSLDRFWALAATRRLVRRGYDIEAVVAGMRFLLSRRDQFEDAFQRLADEKSRSRFEEILKYRMLGGRHVKLSTNSERYWQLRDDVERRWLKHRNVMNVEGRTLDRFEFSDHRGTVAINALAAHVLNTFVLEQYRYADVSSPIAAREGDIVFDLGGGWGDTALYFARLVGPSGHVFVFEPMPANVAVFRANLQLNPELANRITLLERAGWSHSDERLSFVSDGPSSRANNSSDRSLVVNTLSVDDAVEAHALPRVDFIKMDIEGAEYRALDGAKHTIAAFMPRLAIAAYHRDDDLITLPGQIDRAAYQVFLDHFTITAEETVLFASPVGSRAPAGSPVHDQLRASSGMHADTE